MRCHKCKNESFKQGRKTVKQFGIEVEVAADRCAKCGEMTISADDAKRVDRAVADALVERGIRSGDELKWVRKMAGMRGKELAEVLGVTQDTVSRWETGKVPIPSTVAYVVADLYERPRRARSRLESLRGPPS